MHLAISRYQLLALLLQLGFLWTCFKVFPLGVSGGELVFVGMLYGLLGGCGVFLLAMSRTQRPKEDRFALGLVIVLAMYAPFSITLIDMSMAVSSHAAVFRVAGVLFGFLSLYLLFVLTVMLERELGGKLSAIALSFPWGTVSGVSLYLTGYTTASSTVVILWGLWLGFVSLHTKEGYKKHFEW